MSEENQIQEQTQEQESERPMNGSTITIHTRHDDSQASEEPKVEEVSEEPKADEPKKEEKPNGIPFDRFRAVKKERDENAQRIAELEARLERLTNPQQAQQEAAKPKTLNDFETTEEWEQHLYSEISRKAKEEALAELKRESVEQTQQRAIQQQAQQYAARIEEAAKANPEYKQADEAIASIAPHLPAWMVPELLDASPDVILELAKNPEIIEEIAGMGHVKAAKRLGIMEARYQLRAANASEEKREEKPVAKSGVAPRTVDGGSRAGSIDPSKVSFAEYKAFRDRGGKF